MEKSDKIKLFRLIISFCIFVVLFVLEKLGYFNSLDWYITLVIYIVPYLLAGYDVVFEAFENIFHGEIFDEAFLMLLASVGAFVIAQYEEACAVMILYQIGEFLSDLAVDRSRDSIEELMNITPEYANLQTDEGIKRLKPEEIKISDVIVIKAGERVPLDGIVTEGTTFLDTSALTGESVKRKVSVGDEVLSGCLNGEGTIKIRVTDEYKDSTVAKILDMVENSADKKSKTESFITRFAKVYTPTVTVAALLLAVIPSIILQGEWVVWIRRACTFLVISCPCALVISVPLCFFAGLGVASSRGILIKGGNYLEMLSEVKAIAFDKTGTITEGNFTIKDVVIYDNKYSRSEILKIAAALEQYSNHPIAVSIKDEYVKIAGDADTQLRVDNVEEIPGYGIQGTVDGMTVKLGGYRLIEKNSNSNYVNQNDVAFKNNTVTFLLADDNLIASVIIGDKIKSTSAEAIRDLKRNGIEKCIMLTGDRSDYANAVADATGIDEVYAELLPVEKVTFIEEYIEKYHRNRKSYVAFAGDGINDAPSLMRADIGIAMGMGADAAIEAADVVLTENNLTQIVKAVRLSAKTVWLAKENIIFALSVKVIVLILGALGIVGMWPAVFADVGVALIAILNAMRVKHVV